MPPANGMLTEFDDEMSRVDESVARIRAAIAAATSALGPPPVWMGSAADAWAGDFTGRMGALTRLMDAMEAERPQLRHKVAAQHTGNASF